MKACARQIAFRHNLTEKKDLYNPVLTDCRIRLYNSIAIHVTMDE